MSKATERPLSALDVIFVRRSVRSYTPEKLQDDTIRALLDAAVQAPTAVHEQPWTFVIIQDAEMLKRLSDRAKAAWLQESSLHRAGHGAGLLNPHSAFARELADPDFSTFYTASTLVVICAKPLGPFVTADCWLAAENLMLAACALGLGTCCIGAAVPALNSPDFKAELGMAADVMAVAPIIVGVPAAAAAAPAVSRREPEILYWK